ncbi:MAG TPA: peptidoglycan DD-metalloendopeptidase family protein, partial [Burkholderiales bacterium]
DEKRLAKLVEKLTKLVAPKSSAPGTRNTRVPEPGFEGKPFGALKGSLSLPVKGELANRFGSPRPGGGTTWKGLFIRSPEGQEVRAIAAGRVVFADWLRGFGNLLILDHGQGFMSLYGNNETLFPPVGTAVRGGDVVAAVGNSGGNPESGLYFELRHQGTPLDPMNWVVVR